MKENTKNNLVQECYDASVKLLKNNSMPTGIIACAPSEKAAGRDYASIFGRDAAICSMGMIASKNSRLIKYATKSLLTLAKYQAPNGQIPKYVKPEAEHIDFWYFGCIDATLWWLIAIAFHDRFQRKEPLARKLQIEIRSALHWLLCQEHQGLFLLQQNEASDWADIMPRSGFVLYSNALWYHVKKLYHVPNAQHTRYYFNHIFLPFETDIPDNRRARILMHYVKKAAKKSDFYLSFVNFSFCGEETDVFGNILASLAGVPPLSKASRMTDHLLKLGAAQPYPVRVVLDPLKRGSHLWRSYMQRYKQNFPYQYHNGGIWPFVGGFWILLLAKLGRRTLAWKELERYAEANKLNSWGFNEWLHGKSGEPMGMSGQSWNAAMFILAYHSLHDNFRVF